MSLFRRLSLVVLLPLLAACDTNGDAFMQAIHDGDKARALALLQKNPGLARMIYGRRTTQMHGRPLSEAAYVGNVDLIKLLLEYGADVNGTNRGLETALHVAARGGHVPVVELLIARGALVNPTDTLGQTPLHYAAWSDPSAIQPLLDRGASIGAPDRAGDTPLHLAAAATSLRAAIALCANGADPRARNAKGQSPADLPDDRAPELRLWLSDGCPRLAAEFRRTGNASAEAQRAAFSEYDCETLKRGFIDVTRDRNKATLALQCSAFGRALETGTGIEMDAARAQLVYQVACDNGDRRGCDRVARLQRRSAPGK
jgi:Ankyrin repeats (3 copies)/Ankyrin repeat